MKKYVMGLFIILFCAAPLHAGVEPFFKGEWGMDRNEIIALYDIEQTDPDPGRASLIYQVSIAGEPATVYYVFVLENGVETLVSVMCEFNLAQPTLGNYQKAAAKLMPLMTSAKEPLDFEYTETQIADGWMLLGRGLNQSTFVSVSGQYVPEFVESHKLSFIFSGIYNEDEYQAKHLEYQEFINKYIK